MKKFLFIICFLFLIIPFKVNAKDINIYLFYGEGCSHCAALEKYLETKDNINIYKYEVWFNDDNKKLWEDVQKITKVEAKGVPYYVIGSKTFQGYNETKSWEEAVDNAIENAKTETSDDEVGVFLGKSKEETSSESFEDINETNISDTNIENNSRFNNILKYVIALIIIFDIFVTILYIYKKNKKRL